MKGGSNAQVEIRQRHKRRRRKLFREQQQLCFYCGVSMTLANGYSNTCTVEHLKPRSQGGTNASDNIVAACYTCNHTRGDTCWEAFKEQVSENGRPAPRMQSAPH